MALRTLVTDDLGMILPWRNALNVRLYMFTQHVISDNEHRAWFDRISIDETACWLMFEEDRHPLGVVYFTAIRRESANAFWGFYAKPDPPPGIGRRIEKEALDYAFHTLKLHKLNCEVLSTNQLVINQHKRFGFTQEGLFRDYAFSVDRFQDVVRFGMLADEWKMKRQELQQPTRRRA